MGIFDKAFNGVFGNPPKMPLGKPGNSNQSPAGSNPNYVDRFNKSLSDRKSEPTKAPVSTGPKKFTLRNGTWKDSAIYTNDGKNFAYQIEQRLKNKPISQKARWHIAEQLRLARGGSGITNAEMRDRLDRLERAGRITRQEKWHARSELGIHEDSLI